MGTEIDHNVFRALTLIAHTGADGQGTQDADSSTFSARDLASLYRLGQDGNKIAIRQISDYEALSRFLKPTAKCYDCLCPPHGAIGRRRQVVPTTGAPYEAVALLRNHLNHGAQPSADILADGEAAGMNGTIAAIATSGSCFSRLS
jgi:hypothetical protein